MQDLNWWTMERRKRQEAEMGVGGIQVCGPGWCSYLWDGSIQHRCTYISTNLPLNGIWKGVCARMRVRVCTQEAP